MKDIFTQNTAERKRLYGRSTLNPSQAIEMSCIKPMSNRFECMKKFLGKLIFVFCLTLLSLFVNAQVTEHFSDEVAGATSFTNSGYTFNLTGGRFVIANGPDYGWTGSVKDNFYIDNYGNYPGSAGVLGAITISSGTFKVTDLYVFPGVTGDMVSSAGTVIIRGKLSGATQFTYTIASGSINTNGAINNAYTYANLSSYSSYSLDQLEFEVTGSLRYLAIDAFKFTPVAASTPPTVTTQAVTSITSTTATGNGNITSLGTPDPTAYGVCWNTTGTPTTSDSKIDKGAVSATGAFTASMTGLTANTTYYVRAFATNTAGTSYGTEVSFITSAIAPIVTTQAVSSVAATTATGNGNITSLGVPNPTAYGVCWNTTGTPTTSDSKVDKGAASATGAFTASMAGLTGNTTYYVRAFATNTAGTSYGTEVSFITSPVTPTITTQAVSSIASTTATGNGNITSLGAPNPTAYGVCWNTTGTPTTSDSKVDKGAASATGAFTASITGLTANTTYYVRAFATNTAGTVYGTEVSFNTLGIAPTVTTQAASSVTSTTATGNGNITSLGVPNPTAYGICWNTAGTPTTSDSKVDKGAASATGAFTASMTGLTGNTTYYVRAFATNTAGTSYGTEISFITNPVAPTVTTQAVSSIASTTATGNGNITSLGAPNPTAYGVCWNTTGTPTTSDSKVDKGAASATGAFTASMTSLTANTTYYVRAYATNTAGTVYGTEVSFNTLGIAPTVTTQAVSSIASTTATGNGNITSLGVPNPTAYGVCWNTTGTPTTSDSKVDKGAASATGAFTASMTGLTANTIYYVRAFATNTAGTSYGTQVSFTTSGIAPTVTTQTVSSIASTTATGNGNITSLGVPNPTAYGVCWNTTGTPTTSDSKVDKGAASATGAFTASMTSLTANTIYYVRAYAINTAGTVYGTEVSFTTSPVAPTVTTQAVSSIASTTATGNGNITSLGVPNPTAYGVCWNTTGTPTTSDSKVDKGAASATGAFTASMAGLTGNTLYYVRAFATNIAGTVYGAEVSFTTSPVAPTVTTQAVSAITSTTATGNGSITSLGAPNPTAYGVCWNTSGTPTIANSKVDKGVASATGAFTASMIGLTANTTYYVRAFATNTAGTSYGTEVTFTTNGIAPTVTTQAVSSIATTTATGNGNITSLGIPNPTSYGVCWNTTGTPTTSDSKVDKGAASATGAFTASITGLTPNTTYYLRAYATNIAGTGYGSEVTFVTNEIPTVSFSSASQSSVSESGTLTITVQLSGVSSSNVTVPFTVNSSSTATAVTDYSITASPITITAGNTSGNITINIVADALDENDETVIVDLDTPTNATLGTTTKHTATITDDDETPVVTASQSFSVNENSTAGTVVGTAVATDSDAGTTFSNWTIAANVNPDGDGTNAFAINAATGQITVTDAGDLDKEANASLTIKVTVSDGTNTSAEEDVVINLNDVNDVAPVITASQELHIVEHAANGSTVGTVLATDGDVSSTTFQNWTITAGNSNGYFAVNSSAGVITVIDNAGLDLNVNQSFTLTLTVSDGVNTSLPQTVSIIVSAVNDDNPVVTPNQSFSIDENSANETSVGKVLATDPDYGTVFQDWTITAGNTSNAFAINSTTGVITVNNSSVLDYETTTSFSLTVQVSDGLHTANGVVTVNLNNLNDNTPNINGGTFTLDENSANGTAVGTIVATDADGALNNLTFSVITKTSSPFAINLSTGAVTVSNSSLLDYESINTYSLTIQVSDGVHTASASFTINLNNVNDNAPIVTPATFAIDENSANGTAVGTVVATDADGSLNSLTYSITAGNTNSAFAINSSTGAITVNKVEEINYEVTPEFNLTVTVSDGTLTGNANVKINLNDVVETGIDDNLSLSIKIYPNPAVNRVSVSLDHLSTGSYTLEVLSIIGNKVYQREVNSPSEIQVVDLTGFAEGIYFVKAYNKQFSFTERLIIHK